MSTKHTTSYPIVRVGLVNESGDVCCLRVQSVWPVFQHHPITTAVHAVTMETSITLAT